MEVLMRNLSLKSLLITVFSLMILLSGGLAQAYLAPDYNDPDFAPGGAYEFTIGPGVLPDYLTAPNWAFSPRLRKFIDPLPGLCAPSAANSYCASNTSGAPDLDPMKNKNIPIAVPDKVTYPGSDYYEIELRQYSEMMHTDLVNPTTLRGYIQVNNGTDIAGCTVPTALPLVAGNCTSANNTLLPAVQHFLGPIIIAQKGRPVRVLFRNTINRGTDGDLFLPVDDTIMGAGAYDVNYNPVTKADMRPTITSGMFSTNRATLHLHGGRSPWISDGTPHQWIAPAGEDSFYPQGISVEHVPDMPIPAPNTGEQTFFWTNQQSSRMMFYHDHAWGITRLNVYAGEAAGYLIQDEVEDALVNGGAVGNRTFSAGTIPADQIPLVIMDKTFVDETTIGATDPTWNWGMGSVATPGVVTWITVNNGGSGYDPGAPPAVTITEGENMSASAQAVVSSVITAISLGAPNNGGSGYFSPIVMIDDISGSGAAAEVLPADLVGGVIQKITVTSGGWGYSLTPTITIADLNNDPTLIATATATVASVISAVAVTNGGSGYINPTVTIGDGTGAQATATVTDIKALKTGDLWWPHVYMPAQNPFDVSGIAPLGRWAYGPYFYPATNNLYQPIPNPYFSPDCNPIGATIDTPGYLDGFCQAPEIPSTPNPSWGAEAFMDTPLVNGTAYPYVDLKPQAYRLRILNAAHDRFMNLSMYIADSLAPTEVVTIPAIDPAPKGSPATWPVDGRPGGVPQWADRGPDWIMIGNEGGFLPMPVIIPSHPLTWNINASMFNVGNINGGSLILGPAERADVIVDFSDPKYYGKTLILYNDGSAPWPAWNPQYDFYTGNPDGRPYGAADTTLAGYGPNTRTIMQIRICDSVADPVNCPAGSTFDVTPAGPLFSAFTSTGPATGVFQQAQEPIIAAQGNMNSGADPLLYETFLGSLPYDAYNKAYNNFTFPTTFPNWGISRINDKTIKIKTLLDSDGTMGAPQSIAMKNKAIHDEMGATFDDYGRMRAALGLEKSGGGGLQVNFIVQTYSSPATEKMEAGGIQIWKISHNGVDTHPIHFHLFDVQILNRVGWDGFIRLPDPTEMGWKETVRISPLEDTIIAIKPVTPVLPFGIPTSNRPLNPATPIGDPTEITQIDPITGNAYATPLTNDWYDFKWEYVWHCHILSHEENDMMRPIVFNVPEFAPAAPTLVTAIAGVGPLRVDLTWTHPAPTPTTGNEIGFKIERCAGVGCSGFAQIGTALANTTTYRDTSVSLWTTYSYRVLAYNAVGNSPVSNVLSVAVPPPVASVTISANRTSPDGWVALQAAGGTVTFTANASGGTGSYEYQFRVRTLSPAGAWSNLGTYQTSATKVWTPLAAGSYEIGVLAKNQGSPAAYDVVTSMPFTITAATPPTSVSLSANRATPIAWSTLQTAGGTVTFTAVAGGGTGPYEYQFRIRTLSPLGAWSPTTIYQASNTWIWTPPAIGSYEIGVYAKNQGSTAAFEVTTSMQFNIVTNIPPSAVSISANRSTPIGWATLQTAGGTVTFTANASGGSGPYNYRFRIRTLSPVGAWTYTTIYQASNTWIWTPPAAGSYEIGVMARNQSSTATFEAINSMRFTITLP